MNTNTGKYSFISEDLSHIARNSDVKHNTMYSSLCSVEDFSGKAAQQHRRIEKLVQETMYEMKRNGVVDDIVTQALHEDIDSYSVHNLPPEGTNYK